MLSNFVDHYDTTWRCYQPIKQHSLDNKTISRYCTWRRLECLLPFPLRRAAVFLFFFGSVRHIKLRPDLQNVLRQSYDYLTIMPKLYDRLVTDV